MRNFLATAFVALLAASSSTHSREPIVGLPCEGCEAVFEGLPKTVPARSRIASHGEPGQPMTVTGRVYGVDGKPRSGVIVYAYQTNARGIYPAPTKSNGRASDRHGSLRGWARTGADGRYIFDTVRPASYPTQDVPAHIHMHVIEPRCATYYIDDIMFTDDPLLTPSERRRQTGRAGNGIATPTRSNGRWQVARDIQLGKNIPGYPKCGAGRAAA
jgi:protocatechuate 3,4-dioxygenase beta subunit